MNRSSSSVLYLQLGQEVIYLLLISSILANVFLAAVTIRGSSEARQAKSKFGGLEVKLRAPEQPAIIVGRQDCSKERPPIIALREADGFSFPPGSAGISLKYLVRLKEEVIPRLSELGERYHAWVVEVVGHTDGVGVSQRLRVAANLDNELKQYDKLSTGDNLKPYDNVGLGMSRAVSVALALRKSGLPKKFEIEMLSAANLISPLDRVEPAQADDLMRRRIEIRLRRADASRNE
jgi:flagellar motor protein MotB